VDVRSPGLPRRCDAKDAHGLLRLRADAEIPAQFRDLAEWENALLPGGVGELEAMATGEEPHLGTPWDSWLIDLRSAVTPGQRPWPSIGHPQVFT
jgi:hypothetical protein